MNPLVTLPVLLLSPYVANGPKFTVYQNIGTQYLKYLVYFGIVRWINGYLSRQTLNNWQPSTYDWDREIAVVTGGSDGIGKHISLLLAEKGLQVAILDVQPLAFNPRMIPLDILITCF